MSDRTQKLIGSLLVGLAIILLFILIVIKMNTDKEGAFLCKVVAENPKMSMDDCPAHNSSSSWLIMIAFVVVAVMLVVGLWLSFRDRLSGSPREISTKDAKPEAAVELSRAGPETLEEDETAVVHLLQEHKGSMYQSDIIRSTGYSKVRMTRLLDKMELKKVVERKRRGMANIVILR